MKRIAIITRTSAKKLDYSFLATLDIEIFMYTKHLNVRYYEKMFSEVRGYDDSFNLRKIALDIISAHKNNPFDRILVTNEYDIIIAAELRDYLGIFGQSINSAVQFRDKLIMLEKVAPHLEVPKYSAANNYLDLLNFEEEMGYPFVIKPRLESGSIGVRIVNDGGELTNYIEKNSCENILAEEFISGDMYHIDGLMNSGEIMTIVPSRYLNGCLAYRSHSFIGSVMVEKANPLYNPIVRYVKELLVKMETPDYDIPFHCEVFVTKDNRILLCEIASRIGGGRILETVKLIKGIDMLQCTSISEIEHKKGRYVENGKLGGFILIPPRKGILIDFILADFKWIKDTQAKAQIGKDYNDPIHSGDSMLAFTIEGTSERDVEEKILELYRWQYAHMQWDIPESQDD